VGKTIHLPGVHFRAQRDSLVLGISTSCHFCNESMPFYKGLANQLKGRLDLVAVLPQAQTEAENYVKAAGLSEARVVSSNLGSIGVYATPTLLLVDSTGKVKSEWVGKLDDATQKKVLATVLPSTTAAVPRT
jgi:thioredoxin-related protein